MVDSAIRISRLDRNGAIPNPTCVTKGSTVSTSATGSIDRRDAAVAAALAGTVVVVLGYASGVGIQTSSDPVAVQQPPAAQPVAPPAQASEIPVVPPTVQLPVAAAQPPAAQVPHEHPRPTTSHDHTPVEPTPTPEPEPEPEPTPTTCPPSLLEGLPIAGPVVEAASKLLFTVVSAAPVLSDLDAVTCTVGELVGPTCCSPAGANTRAEPGP